MSITRPFVHEWMAWHPRTNLVWSAWTHISFFPYFFSLFVFVLICITIGSVLIIFSLSLLCTFLLYCFSVYLITSWYLLAKIENNNSKQPTFRQQELPPKQEVKQCVINYKCKKTFKVLSYHIIPAYEFDLMY